GHHHVRETPLLGCAEKENMTVRCILDVRESLYEQLLAHDGFVTDGLFEDWAERVLANHSDDQGISAVLECFVRPCDELGKVEEECGLDLRHRRGWGLRPDEDASKWNP